jgi:pseudouridine synthase
VVKKLGNKSIEMTIVEGKNRQVRRMCAFVGYTVRSLERIKIGKLDLRGIACGMWRYLSNTEVDAILACSIQKTKK